MLSVNKRKTNIVDLITAGIHTHTYNDLRRLHAVLITNIVENIAIGQ